MKKCEVSFVVECPDDLISMEDFLEWVEFEVGLRNDIRIENALEYAEMRDYIKQARLKSIDA